MKKYFSQNKSDAFTLIELLVVIAILAILATVIVVIINPGELLKQSRDTDRMADLATLNKTLGLLIADQVNVSLGTSTNIYVSIPDSSPTCANLGLPTPPTGYAYACVSTSTYRKVDGTGWVPVNLTSISSGSPLSTLPTDPVNTTSTSFFYIYVASSTPGFFEVSTLLESQKYKYGGSLDKASTDGGNSSVYYEQGSSLTTNPINDSGLVGWWKFDEASGTSATDSSIYGNTGTMFTSSTQSNIFSTSGCKIGSCTSFNGANQNIRVPAGVGDELYLTDAVTLSTWIQYGGLGLNTPFVISKGWSDAYQLVMSSGKANLQIFKAGPVLCGNVSSATTLQTGTWYHVVGTYDGQNAKIYINGIYEAQAVCGFPMNPWSGYLKIGSNYQANTDFVNYPSYWQMFKGSLDDVRVYNRALSPAEILALYNATR